MSQDRAGAQPPTAPAFAPEPATFASLGLAGALTLGARPAPETVIESLAVDSREVGVNGLFVALAGAETHGARYAGQALARGAQAILTDLDGAVRLRAALGGWPKPVLVVEDPRRVLARLAARFHPGQPKTLVAVTGTNGKTSTTRFLQQIWAMLGRPAAVFGTTGLVGRNLAGGDLDEPCTHTTPEPITLHRLLARLAEAGAERVAMEASSHGLAQCRLHGATVAAGGFTNLTRDHLDYHVDAEAYAAAKLLLFAEVVRPGGGAVLNADDPVYPLAATVAAARGLEILPIGRAAGERGLAVLAQDPTLRGQTLRIGWRGASRLVDLPLVGAFQAWNALTAAGLAILTGSDPDGVFDALTRLQGAPGRMEMVARRANGAGVFVDYAHTPDAIATAIQAIRPHAPGRVHILFGAGGDRDPGKRPLMAAAAAAADVVYVTDDNPRRETPAAIRAQVMAGFGSAIGRVTEVDDRAEAILRAVDGLEAGDVLLVAGKGHETGQDFGDRVLPFEDAEQARAAVLALDGEEGALVGD